MGRAVPGPPRLSKLRLLETVGEPINPKAWVWYHHVVGGERCPIVDTWWQTETGCIMIAPLPGITATKPGSATRPLPGVFAAVVGEDGEELEFVADEEQTLDRLRNADERRLLRTRAGEFGDRIAQLVGHVTDESQFRRLVV